MNRDRGGQLRMGWLELVLRNVLDSEQQQKGWRKDSLSSMCNLRVCFFIENWLGEKYLCAHYSPQNQRLSAVVPLPTAWS